MVSFRHRGDFSKTTRFLTRIKLLDVDAILEEYGKKGVDALAEATPKRTGKTAASWSYKVIRNRNDVRIRWSNSNFVDGVPVAIVLQYGHATRNGAYVQGIDYINPALKPVFDELAHKLWKEVAAK